ncbi:MAG: DUF3054 domain-containing protein [Haloarculaceae archaeon]
MSTHSGFVGRRIDATPLTLAVAIGDVLAIGLFVAIGELNHGVSLLAQLGRAVDTAVPFLIGWWIFAVFGGLYTADAWRSPKRAAAKTFPAWVGADLLAQLLRATPLFHGDAAVTFFLVAAAAGGLLIVGWRVVVSRYGTRA